ncbi:hypothetical protein HMPREF9136_0840 [Prevotella dentalis DSM 3688]|uniref:Uncharacterized protein n=1 Tax=Prevotella dentalis (strain ATCC 49559 / DSM 3688 / JCM 13448 / NCTC 12043 / ES 2772) TaxID=908937 RepID=F9D1W2_PREDD|nr:hypothetical protein HMPREF9136_0840 [Prevotella dentalis DSM 3688]
MEHTTRCAAARMPKTESRAVSHDTARTKRDIIKTQYRGVL